MIALEMNPATGGPYIDDNYLTNRTGIFICGNAAFVNDLADYATIEGEIAGWAAADFIKTPTRKTIRVKVVAGDNIRFIAPNFITRKDEVTLYMRVTEPKLDVRIKSTDEIVKIKKQIVKPSEMIEIKLDSEKLERISKLEEFRIDVVRNK
jgi:hypothetical protein